MTNEHLLNNYVELKGEVVSAPEVDHTVMDEKFYTFKLKTMRLSGKDDTLNIMLSEKLLSLNPIKVGDKIALNGQFRSHNQPKLAGGSHLLLYVFCRNILDVKSATNSNQIELNGYICRQPIFRTTPFTREICDLLLAVNRNYDKSDYIPCILWGLNARFVASLKIGDKLSISGRIQSREYTKTVGEQTVIKTAYEVSVNKVDLVENVKNSDVL